MKTMQSKGKPLQTQFTIKRKWCSIHKKTLHYACINCIRENKEDGKIPEDIFATNLTHVLLGLIIGILLTIFIYVIALTLGA